MTGLASDNSRGRRTILIILALALAVRLAWGLTRPTNDAAIDALPDQRDYLSLAQNLVHGRGLNFLDKRFDDTVWAFRMPGYPLFLAVCGANVRAVRAVQGLIDASTVLAIYLLAAILMQGRRGAAIIPLMAATLVAIDPYLIYFSGLLLSETLFTAMLAWGMVLLVRGNEGWGGSWLATLVWLCGGILLALSVLVRPSAAVLPVVLGLAAAFVNRPETGAYREAARSSEPAGRTQHGRWPLPVGATMVFLVLASLLPWALRNRYVLGRWIWLDTNSGFTLSDGYNPDATGGSDQSYIDREPELQVLGEIGRSEYLTDKAIEYLNTHRWQAVDLAGVRLKRLWSPMPLCSEYGGTKYRLIALAFSVPFDVMILLGLIWGGMPQTAKVFLLAPAIYFSIIHALTVGSLRYRIPVEPPMALIAASFLAATSSPRPRRRGFDVA